MSKVKLLERIKVEIQKDIDAGLHPVEIAKKYGISLPLLYENFKVNYRERKIQKILDEVVRMRRLGFPQWKIAEVLKISEVSVRRYNHLAIEKGLLSEFRASQWRKNVKR